MRAILFIPLLFFGFCHAEDYIVEFQAKVKNLIDIIFLKLKV